MPYTRPWPQVNNLLGSRDADEIDEASRETHLDLTERLSDILFDVTADPWKVKIPGVASDGNTSHPVAGVTGVVTFGTPQRTNADIASQNTSQLGLQFPILAAGGSNIVNVQIWGYRTIAGAAVTAMLIAVDYTTGVATTMSTFALDLVQPGPQQRGAGVVSFPVSAQNVYYLNVNIAPDASGPTTARLLAIYYTVKLPGTP